MKLCTLFDLRRAAALTCTLAGLTVLAAPTRAQDADPAGTAPPAFKDARASIELQLAESLQELSALREAITAERVPMGETLSALELELIEVRQENQRVTRLFDSRTLDLSNLRTELKQRQDEVGFLSNLLAEYIRNFKSRLHVSEEQRYLPVLDEADMAAEDKTRSDKDIFAVQAKVLSASLERLRDALGGTRFEGKAIDADGLVNQGTFVLVGPVAVFSSRSGEAVGTAEQRLSTEPVIVGFSDPLQAAATTKLVKDGAGMLLFDATLGNAHKVEATNETFVEHVKKGGPIMIPIFVMAGAALLVAVVKWLSFAFLRRPSRKSVNALLDAVGRQDEAAAQKSGSAVSEKGPLGRMLWVGVQHMREPRELVEEAMYETVLTSKNRLQSFLPFIAICAASAPLLGLLGTVTGIINTFKMIELFGAGDVKSLSGGISEALITTKWGLIVAIPSLLLHAFLARKARGVTASMEATAVAFVNRLAKSHPDDARVLSADAGHARATSADPDLVRAEVQKILGELLGPLDDSNGRKRAPVAHR
ncbi:MAG: MotA/TolQ/ExbB proton channel family protein [Planctomycetota bacterium]